MHPIQELKEICNNQKTITTPRLLKIVKEVERSYIQQGKSVRAYRKILREREEQHAQRRDKGGN